MVTQDARRLSPQESTRYRDNPYAKANRLAKTAKLVAEIDKDLGPEIAHRNAAQIVEQLKTWTSKQWDDLAELAGVRPPDTSRNEVIDAFRARAAAQPHRCPRGHVACYRSACSNHGGSR